MADWEIKNAADVAGALDWLRRRMNASSGGSGLVLVAIGPNSVAYALDPKLSPKDAVALLSTQLEQGTLERGLVNLKRGGVTRGYQRREDV